MEGIVEEKRNRMIQRIIELEKENVKTGKKGNNEMVNAIKKIIEEEAKCY